MLGTYISFTLLAAVANLYAAASDFTRPAWLLNNMKMLGVSTSWLPILGVLKAAGAVGLLFGIAVPMIGVAAGIGLTLFFIGAIITHLRAGDRSLGSGVPVLFLLVAVAALALRVYYRGFLV
ncbi:MAG: DoxX family protein [Acidobacteriaceae bacterium]